MYKNQLQELAQRSCFNLPAYSCIREGPDHAPRFKATVNFNGEIFESPNFCTTLRQAEHAAAEVALNTLSKRGPSQFLAAKILDETGVCKNLLQEAAQRAGVSLPVYTTIKGGPGHLPVFKCLVEVAGRVFAGEPAKTKKQAEKNAAMAAWSIVKQWTQPPISESPDHEDNSNAGALTVYKRGDKAQNTSQLQAAQRRHGGRSRVRVVNVRERNRMSGEGSPAGHFQYGGSSLSSPSSDIAYEDGRFLFSGQSHAGNSDSPRSMSGFQRNPPFFGSASPRLSGPDMYTTGMVGGGTGSRVLPLPWHHHQAPRQQQRLSRLSLQSHSDRFELRRPLLEELDVLHGEGEDDWRVLPLSGVDNTSTHTHLQQQQQAPRNVEDSVRVPPLNRRAMFQSQSERFELKPSLLDELYHKDEEEWWLRGELMQPVALLERARTAMHQDVENGSYVFYDGNMGSSAYNSPESISQATVFNDDFGSFGKSYRNGYSGMRGSVTQSHSHVNFNEGPKILSSFPDLNDEPLKASYEDVTRSSSFRDASGFGDGGSAYSVGSNDMERGSSSFLSFTHQHPTQFHSVNDGTEAMLSPCPKSINRMSSFIDDDQGASSSSSLWSRPAHTWASHPTAKVVAQSLGLRPASSLAPPVRVRQMVAVCSAPPPRYPTNDPATPGSSSHMSNQAYHQHPGEHSSNSLDASAHLFHQLRI